MIAEGQAEPWEAVATPARPRQARAMYSSMPLDMIRNFFLVIGSTEGKAFVLDGYLFWGAEYWLLHDGAMTRVTCGPSRASSNPPDQGRVFFR